MKMNKIHRINKERSNISNYPAECAYEEKGENLTMRRIIVAISMIIFAILASVVSASAAEENVTWTFKSGTDTVTFSIPKTVECGVDQKTRVTLKASNDKFLYTVSWQYPGSYVEIADKTTYGSYWGTDAGITLKGIRLSSSCQLFIATIRVFDKSTKNLLAEESLRAGLNVEKEIKVNNQVADNTATTKDDTKTSNDTEKDSWSFKRGSKKITFSVPKNITMTVGTFKRIYVSVTGSSNYLYLVSYSYSPSYLISSGKAYMGNYFDTKASIGIKAVNASGETKNLVMTVDVYDKTTKEKLATGKLTSSINIIPTADGETSAVKNKVTSLELSSREVGMYIGDVQKLTATYTYKGKKPSVTWYSSNKNVATVDNNGNITAVGNGVTTITVHVGDNYGETGGTGAACYVAVGKEAIRGIEGYFVDASKCYTLLNELRSTAGISYINKDNTTYTIFNTKSSNTLKALKRNITLEKYARTRAKEVATYFSHTRPSGEDSLTKVGSINVCAENIAAGYGTADKVMKGWAEENLSYANQGHRRNMLNKNLGKVGIACYYKKGTYYWVQVFAV